MNQTIIRIKEVILECKQDGKKLSEVIDQYLIPSSVEKKKNAEVSTPYKLRQEMLNTIPLDFWTSPKRVLEPCSGKGGFLLDIVDRFMEGLKETIEEDEERYRFIVEKCLYWCELNPLNVFICKTLLDPEDKYELNYLEGNTLEMDVLGMIKDEEIFREERKFDLVVGNPPYNSSGNTGTGNTIWQNFVKKSLNEFLIINGLLLFIHPSGWRKPESEKSRFKN